MEKLLKIPYTVFNNEWDLLQKFLERRGNPRYELVGFVDLSFRDDIFNLGNLVRVDGDLQLSWSSIQSLGGLEYVNGHLSLYSTPIESLGNLKYVGAKLDLAYSSIQSLGNLEYVGDHLLLFYTPIQSLGNLKYVDIAIWLSENHEIPEDELTRFKIKYY